VTPHFYWLAPGRYQVQIEPQALARLLALCREGWPRETGGILVGHYSPELETAFILDALPPPVDSRRGRTWLVRGVAGLARQLDRLWRSVPRQHYLGEWHLHPGAAPQPSRRDLDEMQAIAAGRDCAVPILLLVGGSPGSGFRFGLWVFRRGRRPAQLAEAAR
jgi:integrative and conjugative element protein (TIGR02256 family)